MKTTIARRTRGLTLVELLVVIVVVASLAATAFAAARSVRTKAASVNDLSRMRNIGIALFNWAGDHGGKLPRSSHSATGHGELGWQREILPFLGYPDASRESLVQAKPRSFGVDPARPPLITPALNVYFELNPEYDDYEEAPQTWRDPSQVPNPAATVLVIDAIGAADHIMAQFFGGRVGDLPAPRHSGKQGVILWMDGRASLEDPGSVFDPAKRIDRFHPAKAR